ncbi:Zn-dependent alcohol dehydrogenase [Pseudomonadales bacterium]|jgi:S-(hydroxymethyl)glutathione dehydrogenase/alcohol dehydrogenase|nr:Zn-dependent alcohol dehydrogenase [Gammaproteobacteria bacterium]MDA7754137.1 Zn-dependent alcohol dehydrogenase [Pseudomonadales bacterium]MBT3564459.1 Zn-dependent alcohol dehydrogenase [Gammaproteobacteria bacterium]MBT3708184.1 Zn-dependent alcohol dehydrogenase [Gammaproteobacteria bacterium]MBT3734676.1 Zn-dependent alcohol dehydrogenase [Gammaproteobacteria bacterium]|tara:strand:- start:1088 stop:2173 length:1086 start_codon:yes stop_codon:yes gene_type:complete
MKAAVLREHNKPLVIEEVQVSKPGPREVLVRTVAAGVCHSDVHFMDGSYPYMLPTILGHESAGIVEEVGSSVTYVKKGDHVITCLSAFCGHCDKCLTGHLSLCSSPDVSRKEDEESRLIQDSNPIHQFLNLSSFAEMMLIHEHALVKVREDMPFDRAALIGCSTTTGVGAVFHTAGVEPGSKVAVIGCGGVGLAAINGAAIAGAAEIIAVDMVDSKLELAKALGATHTVNAGNCDAVGEVQELTKGGCDYTFEAIGLKATAEQAFKMLGAGGTATVIGMIPVGTMIEIHGAELLSEKKIQGSNMGSNRFRVDMPRFVDFYLSGKLHLDQMISKHIKLEDVNDALQALKTGQEARHVIMFDQ